MTESKSNAIYSPIELKGLAKYVSLTYHRSLEHAIRTFCELEIADLMVEYQAPITASQISKLKGNNWNAELLYRLLRVIADADIIKQVNNDGDDFNRQIHPEETFQYQLTDDGLLLTISHSSKARDLVRFDLNSSWEMATTHLPSLIKDGYKNGNCFEKEFGCSLFEYMKKEENKEFAKMFDNSMVTYSHLVISAVTSVIDFSRFNKLVDIAGGLGTLLASILEKNQNLHGILFDLKHVIENAKTVDPNEFQQRQIDAKRYEFVVGDMFNFETVPPADAYSLKAILHDWNDEKCVEILQSIHKANRGQAMKTITVFIIEMIILSNGKDNWETHAMDLDMLIGLSSKERNLFEYINILNKSGFEFKQLYKTQSIISIIEAVATTDDSFTNDLRIY